MRITNQMLTNGLLYNLRHNTEKLHKVQGQIASGKRFSRPSDDPAAVSQVLDISTEAAQNEQYLRNLEGAAAWLGTTEAALSDLTEVIQRVRELALQCSNDTLAAEERAAAAKEVGELLEHAVQVANTQHVGQYVFAGFQTTTAPFTLSGGPPPDTVAFNGDSGDIQRSVGPGLTITVNSKAGAELQALCSTLIKLRDDLTAGDSPGARLSELDSSLDALLKLSTEVGARMNRVELTTSRLEDTKLNLIELRSQTEDIEMDEAAVELMAQQNVYQAALAAGARVIQPSLLDHLR